MTNETEPLPAGKDAGLRGCLTLAAVFLVVSVAGALVTLMLFALIVQDWGLISVPRDFGYEMILYAPLSGLVCGFAAAFWTARGGASARRAPVMLRFGLIAAGALLLVFFGLGTVG